MHLVCEGPHLLRIALNGSLIKLLSITLGLVSNRPCRPPDGEDTCTTRMIVSTLRQHDLCLPRGPVAMSGWLLLQNLRNIEVP